MLSSKSVELADKREQCVMIWICVQVYDSYVFRCMTAMWLRHCSLKQKVCSSNPGHVKKYLSKISFSKTLYIHLLQLGHEHERCPEHSQRRVAALRL